MMMFQKIISSCYQSSELQKILQWNAKSQNAQIVATWTAAAVASMKNEILTWNAITYFQKASISIAWIKGGSSRPFLI